MTQRLKYTELAPHGIAAMRSLEHYCNAETLLAPVLLELVRLRASHLNGCEYCIGMHTHELTKHNETPDRIARTTDPHGFHGYTHRELAAFAWTDAVTNIQQDHASDQAYAAAREHFSELDLVNLTLAIVSINAWNRMAIAFRAERRVQRHPEDTQKSRQFDSTPLEAQVAARIHQQPGVTLDPQQAEQLAVGDDGGKVAVDG